MDSYSRRPLRSTMRMLGVLKRLGQAVERGQTLEQPEVNPDQESEEQDQDRSEE